MFTRFFIDRPIFATVLSIIVVLAGGVALTSLPVAQYPDITPPTIEVSAVYPGANARTVADTVAAPIEQQVNGVEDMMYMSSTCANDGTYTLTVTFRPGIDLNIAQVLVQNRVNLAEPVLPDLVKRRGVTVKKKSPSQLMIINLYATGPEAESDDPATRSKVLLYLSNYATIQLRDELARLGGVGDITYLGQRDYSMRVWLDPEKLAAKGLAAADVTHAIEQQNAQVAAGQIGQPPAPSKQAFQYAINTLGRLTTEDQFREMILKSDETGERVVRLKDVAKVELGALSYDQSCTLNGKPSVALSVYQLPGTNAIDTADRVRAKMEELSVRFPENVKFAIVYDTTPFIRESIDEVFVTLRDAVVLVAIVMLVFLQSWRAAIIPLAAVPVAIVGTFAAMAALGYSVNNLTLFGLVLAVGIVVDDAIVVVEAVQHYLEEGLSPKEATAKAMDAVAGPVIAVGLVLTAVFVPCVFISGIVGEFYRQFAVTIAVSTLLSAFNSLTLSPALCALLMKHTPPGEASEPLPRIAFPLAGAGLAYWLLTEHLRGVPALAGLSPVAVPVIAALAGGLVGWVLRIVLNRTLGYLFRGFNTVFDGVTKGYLLIVAGALRLSLVVLIGYGGLLYLTYHVINTTPAGFIPPQDKGYLLVNVVLPDAASLGRTEEQMRLLEATARKTPGVKHTVTVSGQSVLLGTNAPNFGTLYVMLDDFPNRHAHDLGADAIAAKLQGQLGAAVPGSEITVLGAPPVDGLGNAGGFKLIVEDPNATGAQALEDAGRQLVAAAGQEPELRDVFTGFRADTPWLTLNIDRDAAQTMGVSVSEIVNALQVYFGSLYVNDFNLFGRTWQVNVQGDERFRKQVADLKRLRVKSARVEAENRAAAERARAADQPVPAPREVMVPVAGFISVKEATGPVMLLRYNLYPSISINATPAPGVSSGQAITAMERAATGLPPTMKPEWTELALLQLQTRDTAVKAFVLSVVLVFLVLAAQYESWGLPLAVILVVPMCLLSAAVGVRAAGLDINIFTQVGFVVLVGLACKNAILIVEFAKQRADTGADRYTAAMEASRLRFRPIVMTSFAFVFGVVPLVLAEGAGAEMRRALGTAVFAGMLGVTLFGIFLTPVFFVAVRRVTETWTRFRGHPVEAPSAPAATPAGHH
ncbi:cation multidrug efflux pump : Transporter, hydrophobe/amphiphile efflux-1 (HAE1) family OS=Planctomyces limnophilus (strain ATCC 43296 / DSM 3776 / IFAM 1008 / 290) GN=Plim_2295 PE=4 SV=1: ACR_tran: ACR_tran [Gemmataceae bacterium]|nr:cation multidrug efflux pump : Transporter, hydrophobe/amphiphile efflux-1 (HAE1) family OS=Planctomyces limnophilus (strain ATCC 43296 / DSM 3776 / IFAM 1008 / 290) GN=Plim_2295 PE=4 SV=1: ACR_tran: ACR_tran [Gemmataceae bacterium]VTT96915.1 cation multidrug efflux pump : Transporter, hydrophobe/amphiphile efflux-1 (HAE1) family OS=Planctomyces limnophilus (strain ATCC 43296 / DSM 3776 / IFAM 1008 / 290) GN=Plim_2295 PE=4 SV=1: ACR_tran: ACR_tran [Gemmataceae bacterium]